MYKVATGPLTGVKCPDTPADVVRDPIDDFIHRMEASEKRRELATRRRRTARPPASNRRALSANDRGASRHKIDLVLYVSANSEKSRKALHAVHSVLARYQASQIKFSVLDLSNSDDGGADGVIFTPTLVKRAPGPRTWIVGNLDHPEALIDLLDVSGVERRRT